MRKQSVNLRLAATATMVLGSLVAADLAVAQQSALEEVVVTARKREENLQDVGAAVIALGTQELSLRSDKDLQDFANAAPNVIIDDLQQGPGSPAAISIRGIGTTDVEKNFDPTAGVVVDGVFIGVNSGAMVKALDLQSVEILRGPQGTLFGRNSIAGVINITRQRPGSELGGEIRAGYGNYNDMQLEGYINIPAGDQLSFKLAGALNNRDGYFYNRTLGQRSGKQDFSSISPSILWRPTENLEFYYRYDRNEQDQDSNTVQNLAQPDQLFCFYYGQCAPSLTTPQSGDRYDVLQDEPGKNAFFNSDMHVFNARWDVAPGYRLEYLFGNFETDEEVTQDWDGTALTLYHTDRPATYAQNSHELRLTHVTDSPLSYTLGAYYWKSNYRIDLLSFIGFGDAIGFWTCPAPPTGQPHVPCFVLPISQTVAQHTESYAGFFEGDYQFSDAWTLTLGGRYTKDKKDSGLIDAGMPQLATEGSLSNPFKKNWSEFTPKASLRYRYSPDLMVFGLYSKGFRAGGFSGRPGTYEAASTPYDPETVDNFEVGIKSEWMDHRVRLNASAYLMKYKDKQEEQSVPTSTGTGQQTIVFNASTAEIKGLEVDLLMLPATGWTLAFTLGLLDSNYTKFTELDTTTPDPTDVVDISYLKLRRAPDVTATITPSYEWPMLGGQMSVQASWHYIDKLELTFYNSPQGHNPSQNIADASINYQRNNTLISLWGANLTDEDSWSQAYDVGTSRTFAGLWTYTTTRPPRTYGLRLTQKF
jgi:iron complex outermembrane receptor protein